MTSVSDMLKWEEEWKDEEDVATRVKLLSGKDADKFLAVCENSFIYPNDWI